MNKTNKYGFMLFLEGDGDDASGGSAPASATQDPWLHNGDDDGSGAPEPEPEPGPANPSATPAPTVPVPPPVFDHEAFAKTLGQTLSQHQQQQQQNRPPTPEEIAEARKALKFFDIDDNFVKEFGNLETQKSALERFRDGITQHLITVVNHLRANDRQEYEGRLTPLQEMIQERETKAREERFGSRFSQFAGDDMKPHVGAAIEQLAAKKAFEGKSEAEIFKLVAEHLAGVAKKFNPSFVLQDGSAGSSPSPSRQGNGIPVSSNGTGASRGNGQPAAKKGWALAHMK